MSSPIARAGTGVLLAGLLLGSEPRGQEALVLFTTDNGGSVGPCPGCPERAGEGGLARRATALAQARSATPGLLLLDAGDAVFGAQSVESHGRVIVAAYNALGYDALNLTFRELREGKAAALALLKEARFAVVSANLLDAETGAPLARPFAVFGEGDAKIAVIGVSEAPAGQEYLPHLRAQLAGVRVRPPVEALREWLPAARKAAPTVVLLHHGTASGLRSVLEAVGSEVAAVLVAGLRPEHLPAGARAGLAVVATAGQGRELGRVAMGGKGAAARALDPIPVTAGLAPNGDLEALLSSFRPVPTLPPPASAGVPGERAGVPGERGGAAGELASTPGQLPADLASGRAWRLDLRSQNRGARLTVFSAILLQSYGELESAAGQRLLVLDTEWENVIPLTVIQEHKVPTEYRIANLADHLYLVVNGSRLARLTPEAPALAGHVPVKDFRLEHIGARVRGNVIFQVPERGLESLELRFYDYAHGNITTALGGPATRAAEPPLGPPQKNEVLEAAVWSMTKLDDPSVTVPAGMELVAVELRARSLFQVEADASVFDPKAAAGARVKVGTVADWLESRRHVQLVADGEYAYSPLPASTLAAEPRFLPDVATGGRLVFLVPVQRASLELRCDFPNARSSLDGQLFRPKGISIALEGTRPALAPPKALVAVTDDVFEVSVTGIAFEGGAAEAGQRVVVLAVTVANTGKKGEHFQTPEQLRLALADGTLVAIDRGLDGLRPPASLLWIPPGERRSFAAAYRVPAAEARLRLAYAGVSLQKTLPLPLPEPGPPPVAAGAKTPDAPAAKPPVIVLPVEKTAGDQPPAAEPVAKTPPTRPTVPAEQLVPPVAKPPRVPRGIAGVGLTPEQVNESIDRGAAVLWKHIKENDIKAHHKFGAEKEHTIAALALVHAGAHKKHPDFDAALRAWLPAIDPARGDVYMAGITCMLVESYGDPSFLPTLRRTVRYLLEVQGPEGSWDYSRSLPADILRDPAEDQVIQVSGGVPLDGGELTTPSARITPWKEGRNGDNSLSQYALLGLQSASRSGIPIDAEVWKRSVASFRSRQGDDGNWYYNSLSRVGYGSMTCAGICSIAIARHELGEREPGNDPAIDKALAWLVRHFSLVQHPQMNPGGKWRFYYLYSLERVGRVLGVDFIGDHEWYPEGAQHLVATQLPDGRWIGEYDEKDPRLATSFALLFLTRATPTLAPHEVARGGNGLLRTGVQLPRGNRYYIILDASGSMLAELDGKTKWQVARDAVARLVGELPDGSHVALRVYGHRKTAIEPGASDDTALEIPLQPLVKKDFAAKLQSLRARGKTPLARSLLEAKLNLAGAVAADPVTVILLTDGGEDTLPRQDPLAAAAQFGELKGVRLHVIGFDIGREDWSTQLQAIAQRARGSYWPAMSAANLAAELRSAVFGVPAGFAVLDHDGKEAVGGAFGKEATLPEGRYVLRTSYAGAQHEQGFWINTGRTTSVVFNAARAAKLAPAPGEAKGGVTPAPQAGTGDPKPPPQVPKAQFCSQCGKPLQPDAKFCAHCGTKAKG